MDIKKMILWVATGVFVAGIAYLGWLWVNDFMHYTQYNNTEEGISMKYPKGWKLVPHPDTGAIVGFVMPKENSLTLFQANWNISATQLKEDITLAQYVKAADAQMMFTFPDVTPSAKPVKLSGHDGYKLTYISKKEDGLILITYVFIYLKVAYNITYADDKEAFQDPKRQQSVETVINSLKVHF